jgi:hypothetical protein
VLTVEFVAVTGGGACLADLRRCLPALSAAFFAAETAFLAALASALAALTSLVSVESFRLFLGAFCLVNFPCFFPLFGYSKTMI